MFKKYLKNLTMLFSVIVLMCGCTQSHSIRFDGGNYVLKLSQKSPLTNGYMNEYIKNNENPRRWTSMITVYQYPENSSPIELAKRMESLVKSKNKDAGVFVKEDEKTGAVYIDFLTWAPSKTTGKVTSLEFDVFKFEKDKQKGVNAIQFAYKYDSKNAGNEQVFSVNFKNDRERFIQQIMQQPIPEIITEDISK